MNEYIELKRLARLAKPLLGNGTPEQIKINGRFFELCIKFVPQLIDDLQQERKKPHEIKELQNKIDGAISILKDGYCSWCDWD